MKKLLALLMALAMVATMLTACSGKETPKDTADKGESTEQTDANKEESTEQTDANKEESTEQTDANANNAETEGSTEEEGATRPAPAPETGAASLIGTTTGQVYTNTFANLKFTAPSGWTYATEEERADSTSQAVGDDTSVVYAMSATSETGFSNVELGFIKEELSETEAANEGIQGCTDAGYECSALSTKNVAGITCSYFSTKHMELSAGFVNTHYLIKGMGDYNMYIVYTTSGVTPLDDIIAMFSPAN